MGIVPLNPPSRVSTRLSFADTTSMIPVADFTTIIPLAHANWIEVPAERTTCYHCDLRYDDDPPQHCAGCGAGL